MFSKHERTISIIRNREIVSLLLLSMFMLCNFASPLTQNKCFLQIFKIGSVVWMVDLAITTDLRTFS